MIVQIVELLAEVDFDTSKVSDSRDRTDQEKAIEAKKIFGLFLTLRNQALNSEELVEKVQLFFDYERLLDTIEKTDSFDDLLKIQNKLMQFIKTDESKK